MDNQSKSSNRDRSKLGQLYPTAKTYEQRKSDDERRQKIYRSRLAKHPRLTITAYGSVVFGLIVWFMQNLNAWWFAGGDDRGVVMGYVFFSFSVAFMLIFLIMGWVKYVTKQLYDFEGAAGLFWLAYGVTVAVLIALWSSKLAGDYTNPAWILILTVLHFVALFIGARVSIGRA
jgi:hypothetical protein